jgi:hypothetical protein
MMAESPVLLCGEPLSPRKRERCRIPDEDCRPEVSQDVRIFHLG